MNTKKIEFNIVSIDKFIAEHDHIRYCEAILLKDGSITYAVPSHQMALIKLCDKTIEELCEEIDETVDIFEYLLNLSNCIAIWYNSILLPKHITKEQINSVKLLNKYKLIDIGDDIDETLLHWNDD